MTDLGLTSLRASPFYACGVSRCAVSMATPFEWLRCFSLRCFKFNFVEGFAVLWLRTFLAALFANIKKGAEK